MSTGLKSSQPPSETTAAARPASRAGRRLTFVVVIPVYNHGDTVAQVVRAVLETLPEVCVLAVNDGSTDQTPRILAELAATSACQASGGVGRLQVLRLPRNRGKGFALCTAFRAAGKMGFSHAVTIDADGQHVPTDIVRLMRLARLFPDDLIIGDRQMDFASVPASSRRGRDFSRYWLWLETGQDVPDSQCGLRVYPLTHTLRLRHWFQRFDFETETLARYAWAGRVIRSVPVTCVYFPPARRISHFRPVLDTLRGVRLNVLLVILRLLMIPCRRCEPWFLPEGPRGGGRPAFWRWGFWRRALGRLTCANVSPALASTAVGVGILIAFLPVYGLQTLLAIYVARRLHLNIVLTVAAAQLSSPPLTPLLLLASVEIGHFVLAGHWLTRLSWHRISWHLVFTDWLAPAVVGGLLSGVLAGAAGLLLTRWWLGRRRPSPASALLDPARSYVLGPPGRLP